MEPDEPMMTVRGIFIHETKNAILIWTQNPEIEDEDIQVWFPLSQISKIILHPEDENGEIPVTLLASKWICIQKKLISKEEY